MTTDIDVTQPSTPIERIDESTALLQVIHRAATDPNCDIDKMERLMQMHERMQAKHAEVAFNDAMNRAQARIGRVSTDATNPQTRSRYASYGALDRAIRPIYTTEGFSLSFDTGEGPVDHLRVICYVSHSGGHTRTYHVDMPNDGKGAKGGDVMTKTHAQGSAMSYGSRYLLKAIFNVAIGEDDDDGNNQPPPKLIDEKQQATLADMMEAVQADQPRFLSIFHVTRLADLPAKEYNRALAMLKQKERRLQEGGNR